jgi:hypothetical protein
MFGLAAAAAAVVALRAERIQAGASPQVRRNAKTLSSSEKRRLVEAIRATKGIPSLYDPSMNAYDYWVNLHLDAYYNKIDACPHGARLRPVASLVHAPLRTGPAAS